MPSYYLDSNINIKCNASNCYFSNSNSASQGTYFYSSGVNIDILKRRKKCFIKSGKGLHYNWVSSKRNAPQILGSSITLIRDPLDKI